MLKFVKAASGKALEDVFKLRYRIYCEERGFEKPEDHPGGIERDCYDDHSVHFAAINGDSGVIGTARIILDSIDGFPIEKHCRIDAGVPPIERKKLAEISRLAVSRDFRRRAEDNFVYDGIGACPPNFPPNIDDRRRRHEIVIGLYKCIYVESKRIGLTHWYTAMSRGLYLLLDRMGIPFKSIGPVIDYHGIRSPYLGHIELIERKVQEVNPNFFNDAMEELKRSL